MSASPDDVIEFLVEAIATRVASKLSSARPRWYSPSELPVGCPTGRALRDRCRKLGVPMVKVGREILVDAVVYDDAIAAQAKRPAPPKLTLSDQDAINQMGIVFPIPRKAS